MIIKKLFVTVLFVLSILILKFFFLKNSKRMRERLEKKNPKIIPVFNKFNRMNLFMIEKLFPIMVVLFLVLYWFDIIKFSN